MNMIRTAGRAMAALGLSALLLAGQSAAADPVDLNGFLGGFADDCEGSEAFEEYAWDLGVALNAPPGTGMLPEFPLPGSGDRRTSTYDDSYHVIVPLEGTYRGLRVSELSFAIGRGSGINARFVTFDEEEVRVLDAIGDALEEAASGDLVFHDMELALEDGRPVLMCNFST